MREILFRGKREDTGEWVEGYYVLKAILLGTIEEEVYPTIQTFNGRSYGVIPGTVRQYTGLKDKDGKKIFEGDIVRFRHGGEFDEKGIYFRNYEVEFINTFVTYGLRLRNKGVHFPFKQATATTHDAVVIGNSYDNPELLEEVAGR